MKNSIKQFFEKNSEGKVKNLKQRRMAVRQNDSWSEMDYNPKTARHKSLKNLGLRFK